MTRSFIQTIFKKLGRKKVIALILIILAVIFLRVAIAQKAKKGAETTKIQKGSVLKELILSGEIKADEHAKLAFPTSGKLAWIGVKEGDNVKKGQVLASLDKTALDAAYQQAQANLRKYEATVDYVHDTLKDKETTETYAERDTRTTAEANKDYYYDALRAAEYNLKNADLIAPFAGKVTFVAHPYAGVNILVSETQVEIVNAKTIYFEVSADQNEVINLYEGQEVKIILDSFPEKEFGGKIIFISLSPKEGEAGAIYKIKISFSADLSEVEQLKIGMTGDAHVILNKKDDVLYVPYRFINSDKNGKYLDVGKKGNKVYIDVGLEGEEIVEISGDIEEGDVVYD